MLNNSVLVFLALLISCAVAADASTGIKLTFDSKTGQWTGLHANGRNYISQPAEDASIYWNGGQLPPAQTWKLISIKRSGANTTVIRQAGDWEIRTLTTAKGSEVKRRAIFRWNGKDKVKVIGSALTVPNIRLSKSPNDYYVMPSSFPVTRHRYDSLKDGSRLNESWWIHGEYCLTAVHSPKAKISLIVGYSFEMDEAGIIVNERSHSIDITHRFNTSALLKPGDEIDCGTQIIRLASGNEEKMRNAIAEFSNSIGNGPPADRPEYLKSAVIYENHPWGRLETWTELDRGNRYSRLTTLLPYYQKLGVTTQWLLPVSWRPPWVYSLPAFDRIDPQNGSADELRTLIKTAHEKNIKTLIDLVVYGIRPDSEDVPKLPENVWCYDEKGGKVLVWGGSVQAADCSNPAWQKKIGEVASYWAKNFGFDGTRLDCIGWGQTENWNNPRMNASVAYGGLQLNKVIRDSMRLYNKNSATLPEGAKPLVFKNADMVFGYPLYMKIREMNSTPDLAGWIASLHDWLEFERVCYPKRGVPGIVRFLENHDTVSAAQIFGVGPSQALMALSVFIQGIPMIYQEQETGFSKDLAAWLKLRKNEKCFYNGEASYTSIKCSSPYVMCFLRKSSSGAAVAAINFTGEDIQCSVSWPTAISSAFPDAYDAFSGKRLSCKNKCKIIVPAYRPKILLLKPAGKLPVTKSYDVVDIYSRLNAPSVKSAGNVQLNKQSRWFIHTSEGYLEDDFNNLNAKVMPGESITDVLPVLRRAWNPLTGGLMDGSDYASIGVVSNNGKITRIEFDPTQVNDAKIIDPVGNGENVQLAVTQSSVKKSGIDKSLLSKWMKITPQFVYLNTGKSVLSIARRHGGAPVTWSLDKSDSQSAISLSDVYTDYGIIPNREFVSIDGETNPRMHITASSSSATVAFTGVLRARSWNTVQSCGIAGPRTEYRLEYTVDGSGDINIRLAIRPSVDIPSASAFYAMRMPLKSFISWKAINGSDLEGDKAQARLTESRTSLAKAYRLNTSAGSIIVDSYDTFQNVFLTSDGALYMAMLDGIPRDLKAGQEISASARLRLEQ